ncbi:unnamed protein product [Nippostrongylus brasiliensis]|uniref:Uncharacterized protein n=1 Tax=Nippostrongylus brasiliensis TaxID=27835 RepID=A0A0N4XZS0_NIPBR|nr:unnamed protein product [Nippostrongylus brasiliensis]
MKRRGDVLYDVLVDGNIHRRHANQMRPCGKTHAKTTTLLDLFDLPSATLLHERTEAEDRPPQTPSTSDSTTQNRPTSRTTNEEATTTMETRPKRLHRRPSRLRVDPSLKSYE